MISSMNYLELFRISQNYSNIYLNFFNQLLFEYDLYDQSYSSIGWFPVYDEFVNIFTLQLEQISTSKWVDLLLKTIKIKSDKKKFSRKKKKLFKI